MDIGIGLPTTIPGVRGDQVTEWARRAEAAGFSALSTIDRLVYPNYESLIGLAAAAAVTERIALMTGVALLPLRENAVLTAKQAATLQDLSGGRLVLGLAVGGRPDDFEAAGVPLEGRGRRFEEMLEQMQSIWAGERLGFAGGVGPDVSDNPPTVVVGGAADVVYERAARYAAGWMAGGAPPDALPQAYEKLDAAWSAAGREGEPRRLALTYFSLDDDPEAQVRRTVGDYYAFAGDYRDMVVAGTPKGADEIRARVKAFEDAGCGELLMYPASADPQQVDRLAEVVEP